jgi:hypothetical protein
VDTYDPSLNEDPDGPTPGDAYKIYGALHQVAAGYQLDVGDIKLNIYKLPLTLSEFN